MGYANGEYALFASEADYLRIKNKTEGVRIFPDAFCFFEPF